MECNAFGEKEEICAGQKDVMHRLQRDGKLCDSAEDWKAWFHLNYPGCGEDDKWAENNFKNDGVKLVKEERTTGDNVFIRGLSGVYEKEQKAETKQERHFGKMNTGKMPLTEKGKHLQLGFQERRLDDDSSRGRELISEWDGTATKGSFNLVRKVTKTSDTIDVMGTLEIIGIVGSDGVRPAIDGGGTPGCWSSCPGHRVFIVRNSDEYKLRLTNITVQNGYTVRFHILFYYANCSRLVSN
eukprot:g10986.t1